jgi:hypothetical protein
LIARDGSDGLAAQPSGTPRLLIEMRVLVAVYGSVGGSPSGHGTVVCL